MAKYKVLVASIILSVSFYACTHKSKMIVVAPNDTLVKTNDHYSINDHNNGFQNFDAPDTNVCFQRDVLPVFIASCAKSGCHNAATQAKGYNLSTYAGIKAKGLVPGNSAGSKVYTTCVSGKMPQAPTPKLDSTKLSYIRRWINMGAPNDTNCTVGCDTTHFTYAASIAPMLNSYCYSCHATASAASSGGGIVLETYSGVLTQALNGKLLGDLQHASGNNAMPLGGSQLSDCKITQVRKWIQAGALNN